MIKKKTFYHIGTKEALKDDLLYKRRYEFYTLKDIVDKYTSIKHFYEVFKKKNIKKIRLPEIYFDIQRKVF